MTIPAVCRWLLLLAMLMFAACGGGGGGRDEPVDRGTGTETPAPDDGAETPPLPPGNPPPPEPPPPPVMLSLLTDSGSVGPGRVFDSTVQFAGSARMGLVVEVYLNGQRIGAAMTDADGNWLLDYRGVPLPVGDYAVTLVAVESNGRRTGSQSIFRFSYDPDAPPAPVIVAVAPDSAVVGDGYTADNRLMLLGRAQAEAMVEIFVAGNLLGSVVADADGDWQFDYSDVTLADGAYVFTAEALALDMRSDRSAPFVVTVDTLPPAAPQVLAISPDTGASATDGITGTGQLSFSGTAEAGATVRLLLDDSFVGNSIAAANGAWSFDYSAITVADGDHVITALALDRAGNVSPLSAPLAIQVDSSVVTISSVVPADNSVAAGLADNLAISFATAVNAQSGDIVIRNSADGSIFEAIAVTGPRVSGSGTSTITIDPAANLTGATAYHVQIDATAFSSIAGAGFSGISNATDWNFVTTPTAIVASVPADGATAVALNASLVLTFNEPVTAQVGNVHIVRRSDGSLWDSIDVASAQVSGSGSDTIVVTQTDVLEPATEYAVLIDANAFRNASGAGFAGIDAADALNFMTDNTPVPVVVNVTSPDPDGAYAVGDRFSVQVVFSEIVHLTLGEPLLTLDMDGVDRTVDYVSGSGSDTLVFAYEVVLGDAAADLDYVAADALDLNDARIRSAAFASANLTLPVPGAPGSLSASKDIAVTAAALDLRRFAAADGFMVQGSSAGGALGWAVSGLGDVNGDGFEDFVAAAPEAAGGVVHVVYGAPGATRNTLDTAAISAGANGFRILGRSGDRLGGAVASAGDFNGDGFDDVLVATPFSDDGAADSGAAYVIWGRAGRSSDVNLGSFSASDGVRITTAEAGARIGDSFTDFAGNGQGMMGGGDYNGDGIADLVIGVRNSNVGGARSGRAYVLLGRSGSTRAGIDLDLIDPTGPDGMLISGAAAGWQLGQSARFVGDFDGDGYDDIVVSAIYSSAVSADAGESCLLFGAPGPLFNPLDVTALAGGSGFRISTGNALGLTGHSVGSGDFNADGFSDLLVSSHGASNSGRSANGAAYVIYGNNSGSYSNIDLDTLSGSSGFAIHGAADADGMGHALAGAGDFNGDGIDDLLLGAYRSVDRGPEAGAAWYIMGRNDPLRGDIDLATLTNLDGFKILADAAGDRLGQSISAMDANGDGLGDLLIGAPFGDNASGDGGEAVVIWGRDFSRQILQGQVGSALADNILGSGGNDLIVGGGGADAITAGAGNDVIQVPDTDFFRIDGGTGTDTLALVTGQNNLDLTAMGPEAIKGIEVIDLGDAGNSLVVSRRSVLALSRQTRALQVRGGSADQVLSSAGDAWCYTGTANLGGISHSVYLDGGAILYLQTGISQSAVSSFNRSQQYTFNTTSGGANVASNVGDVPVLVRITNSSILNAVGAGAPDIRFTDGDRLTWLPYEIERWTGTAAEVWVRVPQVDGNSSTDHIVLHYDDRQQGSVADAQNPGRVFEDYAGVWHFHDGNAVAGNPAAGNAGDSTAYQNLAVQSAGTVTRDATFIGSAARFGGADAMTIAYDPAFNVSGRAFSVQAWVKEGAALPILGSYSRRRLLSRRGGVDPSRNWEIWGKTVPFIIGSAQAPEFRIGSALGNDIIDIGVNQFSLLALIGGTGSHWVQLAVVFDPVTGTRTYINGEPDSTSATPHDMEGLQQLVLGDAANSDHDMDEVRLGRRAFSNGYIRLSYENQRSDSRLVSPD